MANFIADAARGRRPAPQGATAAGAEVTAHSKVTMTAAWATNDQIVLGKLPAQHVITDIIIDWPDMDTGANLVYDVGLYAMGTDGAPGTVEDTDAFIAASTSARAASFRERIGAAYVLALASTKVPSDVDRLVVATATTGGAGTAALAIQCLLKYRPAGIDD